MRVYAKHIIMLMVAFGVALGAWGQVRQSEQAIHPDQLSPTRLADILGDTIPEPEKDSVVVIKQNNSVKSPIPY